jgi:hypothetical protein
LAGAARQHKNSSTFALFESQGEWMPDIEQRGQFGGNKQLNIVGAIVQPKTVIQFDPHFTTNRKPIVGSDLNILASAM